MGVMDDNKFCDCRDVKNDSGNLEEQAREILDRINRHISGGDFSKADNPKIKCHLNGEIDTGGKAMNIFQNMATTNETKWLCRRLKEQEELRKAERSEITTLRQRVEELEDGYKHLTDADCQDVKKFQYKLQKLLGEGISYPRIDGKLSTGSKSTLSIVTPGRVGCQKSERKFDNRLDSSKKKILTSKCNLSKRIFCENSKDIIIPWKCPAKKHELIAIDLRCKLNGLLKEFHDYKNENGRALARATEKIVALQISRSHMSNEMDQIRVKNCKYKAKIVQLEKMLAVYPDRDKSISPDVLCDREKSISERTFDRQAESKIGEELKQDRIERLQTLLLERERQIEKLLKAKTSTRSNEKNLKAVRFEEVSINASKGISRRTKDRGLSVRVKICKRDAVTITDKIQKDGETEMEDYENLERISKHTQTELMHLMNNKKDARQIKELIRLTKDLEKNLQLKNHQLSSVNEKWNRRNCEVASLRLKLSDLVETSRNSQMRFEAERVEAQKQIVELETELKEAKAKIVECQEKLLFSERLNESIRSLREDDTGRIAELQLKLKGAERAGNLYKEKLMAYQIALKEKLKNVLKKARACDKELSSLREQLERAEKKDVERATKILDDERAETDRKISSVMEKVEGSERKVKEECAKSIILEDEVRRLRYQLENALYQLRKVNEENAKLTTMMKCQEKEEGGKKGKEVEEARLQKMGQQEDPLLNLGKKLAEAEDSLRAERTRSSALEMELRERIDALQRTESNRKLRILRIRDEMIESLRQQDSLRREKDLALDRIVFLDVKLRQTEMELKDQREKSLRYQEVLREQQEPNKKLTSEHQDNHDVVGLIEFDTDISSGKDVPKDDLERIQIQEAKWRLRLEEIESELKKEKGCFVKFEKTMKNRLMEVLTKAKDCQEIFAILQKRLADAEADVGSARDELTTIEAEKDIRIRELEERLFKVKENLLAERLRGSHLEDAVRNLSSRAEDLVTRLRESVEQGSALEMKLRSVEGELTRENQNSNDLREQVKKLSSDFKMAKRETREANASLKELLAKGAGDGIKIVEMENKLRQSEEVVKRLKARMKEDNARKVVSRAFKATQATTTLKDSGQDPEQLERASKASQTVSTRKTNSTQTRNLAELSAKAVTANCDCVTSHAQTYNPVMQDRATQSVPLTVSTKNIQNNGNQEAFINDSKRTSKSLQNEELASLTNLRESLFLPYGSSNELQESRRTVKDADVRMAKRAQRIEQDNTDADVSDKASGKVESVGASSTDFVKIPRDAEKASESIKLLPATAGSNDSKPSKVTWNNISSNQESEIMIENKRTVTVGDSVDLKETKVGISKGYEKIDTKEFSCDCSLNDVNISSQRSQVEMDFGQFENDANGTVKAVEARGKDVDECLAMTTLSIYKINGTLNPTISPVVVTSHGTQTEMDTKDSLRMIQRFSEWEQSCLCISKSTEIQRDFNNCPSDECLVICFKKLHELHGITEKLALENERLKRHNINDSLDDAFDLDGWLQSLELTELAEVHDRICEVTSKLIDQDSISHKERHEGSLETYQECPESCCMCPETWINFGTPYEVNLTSSRDRNLNNKIAALQKEIQWREREAQIRVDELTSAIQREQIRLLSARNEIYIKPRCYS